jgi:DNA repair exonuclease SbcCD nuclease subunit
MIYGLMADLHLHAWSAFSSMTPEGVNSRLKGLLNEIERAAAEVKAAGGDTLVMAGDVFHVRGSVSPVVLNSTRDCMQRIVDSGVNIVIMPGNHDLEGKHSTRLSSAVTALEMRGVSITNAPTYLMKPRMVLVPWVENIDDLKAAIAALDTGASGFFRQETDLILHAPIDGVIKGLPAHGLNPEYLADLGYKRVFAGHYHHHKRFDCDVHSIGALAHHTWSDVNSKAGFLLVHDDKVEYRKSHLPEFIDLSQLVGLDPDEELPFLVDGNFIRVKVESSKVKDVEAARKELLDMGAKAVLVQAQPKPTERTSTSGAVSVSGSSLEVSVTDFVRSMHPADPVAFDAIVKASLAVLASVDSLGD